MATNEEKRPDLTDIGKSPGSTPAASHAKPKMGRDVAKEMFKGICEELKIDISLMGLDPQVEIDGDEGDTEERQTAQKLISALRFGYLEYKDEVFTLKLKSPINKGTVTILTIPEPTGVQLRGMSKIKKRSDDVGKAMAVLGEVTGLGLPAINKLKSRDLMPAVGVIGLFL